MTGPNIVTDAETDSEPAEYPVIERGTTLAHPDGELLTVRGLWVDGTGMTIVSVIDDDGIRQIPVTDLHDRLEAEDLVPGPSYSIGDRVVGDTHGYKIRDVHGFEDGEDGKQWHYVCDKVRVTRISDDGEETHTVVANEDAEYNPGTTTVVAESALKEIDASVRQALEEP